MGGVPAQIKAGERFGFSILIWILSTAPGPVGRPYEWYDRGSGGCDLRVYPSYSRCFALCGAARPAELVVAAGGPQLGMGKQDAVSTLGDVEFDSAGPRGRADSVADGRFLRTETSPPLFAAQIAISVRGVGRD